MYSRMADSSSLTLRNTPRRIRTFCHMISIHQPLLFLDLVISRNKPSSSVYNFGYFGGSMSDDKSEIQLVNEERKHLEGLFKDRINFHLLFASIFMAAFTSLDNAELRRYGLLAITIISFMIGVAVLRTYLLVRLALQEIRAVQPKTPYGRYHDRVWLKINANDILLAVPFILTVFFFMATIYYWHRASGMADDSLPKAGILYQVDDHSDRRNMTEPAPPPPATKKDTGK